MFQHLWCRLLTQKWITGTGGCLLRLLTHQRWCPGHSPTQEMKCANDVMAAHQQGWNRLTSKPSWDINVVRYWIEVAATGRNTNQGVIAGRVFGCCAEKGAQLPKGCTHRIHKYRVVLQGNVVKDPNYEFALCQYHGSNHARLQAGKAVDCYGCIPGHTIAPCDADLSYIQTELKGHDAWIVLPAEAWPADWWGDD